MFERISMRGRLLLEAAAGNFVWSENMMKVIMTALLSMVPMYEGRYAIPVMLGLKMPAGIAYLLAAVCSTLPMPFILLLLRPLLDWFYTLPIKPVRAFAEWLEKRSAKKHSRMKEENSKGIRGKLKGKISAELLELIGLYVFVALPLPGTGCWTGSAIATLFEMPRRKAAVAITLGNFTACAITLALSLGVISIF